MSLKTPSLCYFRILNCPINLIFFKRWSSEKNYELWKISVRLCFGAPALHPGQAFNECSLDKWWVIIRTEHLVISELEINGTEPWLFSRVLRESKKFLIIPSFGRGIKKNRKMENWNMTSVDFIRDPILCCIALLKFCYIRILSVLCLWGPIIYMISLPLPFVFMALIGFLAHRRYSVNESIK